MNDKCCNNCVYREPLSQTDICWSCDYPVPQWLKDSVAREGFINNPKQSGSECSVFKSRLDVMEEAKNEQ